MLFWLIENEDQVKIFLNRDYKEAFIELIPYNYFSHPQNRERFHAKNHLISIHVNQSIIDEISFQMWLLISYFAIFYSICFHCFTEDAAAVVTNKNFLF